ncbi:hypothetical protein BT96DRAFT_953314 [Gymnopus androsaceus JB14]|uniref:Pre-rRNA-processing protein RIX1 n=1 Tax=Gymnopus androsaceus JB14 TaxID=1447944 RepID=A0A6A4IHY6_9AGAR|nr:hypothetical protein BT96DRAFT_953314 [Gymnopus androsaceus JB14]
MDSHPLKALLSFHLTSDASTVIHLPYVLDTLTPQHFTPSPHLTKWNSRLNSLLHSKDAGARWAGLCLAHRTSVYSKSVMVECAQSWLGTAIPMLSKKDSLPALKASVNLCRIVFSNATDIPEFQRQVSTPNVPKFTAALILFLEKDVDLELKKLALTTLTRLIPLYPNIHRTSHTALSTIVSRIFAQSSPSHVNQELVGLASGLYSVLHFTGGKVGSANLWRKSLDESIGSAWTAFFGVRTTFPDENGRLPQIQLLHEEPTTSVTLSMERLCASIRVLCDLLQSPTQRPVQVPVGSLIKLASQMVLVTAPASADPVVWAVETSIIPRIWKAACDLITCLAKCIGRHLTAYSSKLLSYIAFHLEQKLPGQTDVQNSIDQVNGSGKTKKGKKRLRTYEGDELFRTSGDVVCPAVDDAKVLLTAFLQLLLRNADVSPALHSMASRVILAVFLGLPQMMPMYDSLLSKIREIAIELGSGTTSAMSKSLGLVLDATSSTNVDQDLMRKVDILIHPRLPPLIRPLPNVDSLTLFRSEESTEEVEAREDLGLSNLSTQLPPSPTADVLMAKASERALSPLPSAGSSIVTSTYVAANVAPPVVPHKTRSDPVIPPTVTSTLISAKPAPSYPLETEATKPTGAINHVDSAPSGMVDDDDDDEEMPSINIDSDSDPE